MGPIITRHGGSIDKFLGDGILATFGCTRASSGPAAEAMRALDELRREAVRFSKAMEERFGEPVAIGFALAGGPVLCGTIGDEARFEFTVIGEAVNFATRLEKANKEFGTDALVEADTLQAARDQGYAESVGDAREYEIAMTDRTVRRVIGWQGGA
jgi:adenylate cyclase